MNLGLKRLLFYWISSFLFATIVYAILWIATPNHSVFGAPFRMLLYHDDHPTTFIAIICFFYGIIASLFAHKYSKDNQLKNILLTAIIIVLTIIFSSPFGGILWHYYDMKAGYFPENWGPKMIRLGFEWGLEKGWLILLLSFPYNIIGCFTCYFLTKKGSEIFDSKVLPS